MLSYLMILFFSFAYEDVKNLPLSYQIFTHDGTTMGEKKAREKVCVPRESVNRDHEQKYHRQW